LEEAIYIRQLRRRRSTQSRIKVRFPLGISLS
jgi:hypothetical protein